MEYLVVLILIIIYPYFKKGAEELILDIVSVLLIPVKLFIIIKQWVKKWKTRNTLKNVKK